MRETGRGGLMEQIRLHLGSKPDLVLFRNQSGFVDRGGGRAERYGLTKGASDLIGVLAPNGRIFCCEVKAPGARETPEQKLFRELVTRMGGYACVARSVEEAEDHYHAARRACSCR